jgi:hypothetical protein
MEKNSPQIFWAWLLAASMFYLFSLLPAVAFVRGLRSIDLVIPVAAGAVVFCAAEVGFLFTRYLGVNLNGDAASTTHPSAAWAERLLYYANPLGLAYTLMTHQSRSARILTVWVLVAAFGLLWSYHH